MKKSWQFNSRTIATGLVGWLVATNLLVWLAHSSDWWIFKLAVFLCLLFLPGIALLRVLRISFGRLSASVLYSFGLSILLLMLSGLVANQVGPALGITKPLEAPTALGAWSVMTLILIVIGFIMNHRPIKLPIGAFAEFVKRTWLLMVVSFALPLAAVAGAFRLNNGGDALFASIALCLLAVFIGYAFLRRNHLSDGLLAWLIFIIGLSILLMTSLRGWDIVGHDITHEFRVYTLTHMFGYWDIGIYRDPYNACLSITILPEMFTRLLNISGLVVFKVILQIVFAACPAVLYLLLRQYVSSLGALTGCLLFICYPTFINDSAMLTRQSVAYLFFALALLILSNRTQRGRYKLLFLLCAVGAILSHYSTAYMFVALFAVATVCKLGLLRRQRKRQPGAPRPPSTVLSPLFAVLLFFITFMWYTQITATAGGLLTTIRDSITNIPQIFSDDHKSPDTSTALLFGGGKSQVDLYESYLSQSSRGADGVSADANYMPTLASDTMPLTPLGERAVAMGINPAIITTLRQNFAKFLQILAIAGVIYATYKILWRKPGAIELDYICLGIGGLALLALMVVLPMLSINYGVLRAFQQALIFLLLPMVVLLAYLVRRLNARVKLWLATSGSLFLFFLFTGMFAQLLGGVSPSLSLNNAGLYYGLYYTSQADVQAFAWLKTHVKKQADVRTANVNRALMHDPMYPFRQSGILPSQISSKSYIYLDHSQVKAEKFYTNFESSPLIIEFPLEYYEQARNQIYSTSLTRIYR